MATFEEFFRQATGKLPYEYQRRLAHNGLPEVLEVPTGCGKTGIVLAWLWRRLHGPDTAVTPRRLIYALPQRSLVEQVASQVGGWLTNLSIDSQVAVHIVMGGAGATQRAWRLDMHRPAIVIGTVDSLVSKALNRGYGIARATYPIDFALVTNGAHWVVDEIQLCSESTTTLRQLAAFTAAFGTAEPFGLTCMSATVPERLLGTVDNPAPGRTATVCIEPTDRTGELDRRLAAARTFRRLAAEPGDYRVIAAEIAELHRPGTLTLAVLNTVDAARKVYAALRGGHVPCTLLHSRFRGCERERLVTQLLHEQGERAAQATRPGLADATDAESTWSSTGHIVVATQVVEAGMDLDAAILVTEAAPWPSVVQRAGRCNRAGTTAQAGLYWVPPARHEPYLKEDVESARAQLESLEGRPLTSEGLLGRKVPVADAQVVVLRRPDLIGLFDTSPDLSGADIDIAPYVRDVDDLDVQLAWAEWTPEADASDGRPPAEVKAPGHEWRCRVPLRELAALLKREGVIVWRFDQATRRWTRVTLRGPGRARPGEVLVVSASVGGYDPETGFDPSLKKPVGDVPALASAADLASGTEDAFGADSASVDQGAWVSLTQHSEAARAEASALITALLPSLPPEAAGAVVTAAYLHDVGKAHKTWQDALCKLASPDERARVESGRPWAKSAVKGRLSFDGTRTFRHELASLMLVDGPLHELAKDADDEDLARYLVLAHHGKLRVQVRDPDPEAISARKLLGLTEGTPVAVDPIMGHPATELVPDLEPFALGGERSWTRTALRLRDTYGPFLLAYLETLVRIADWRASAGMEVPE